MRWIVSFHLRRPRIWALGVNYQIVRRLVEELSISAWVGRRLHASHLLELHLSHLILILLCCGNDSLSNDFLYNCLLFLNARHLLALVGQGPHRLLIFTITCPSCRIDSFLWMDDQTSIHCRHPLLLSTAESGRVQPAFWWWLGLSAKTSFFSPRRRASSSTWICVERLAIFSCNLEGVVLEAEGRVNLLSRVLHDLSIAPPVLFIRVLACRAATVRWKNTLGKLITSSLPSAISIYVAQDRVVNKLVLLDEGTCFWNTIGELFSVDNRCLLTCENMREFNIGAHNSGLKSTYSQEIDLKVRRFVTFVS